MMKRNLVLLALVVMLAIAPLLIHPPGTAEFAGADGQAELVIGEIAPDYVPIGHRYSIAELLNQCPDESELTCTEHGASPACAQSWPQARGMAASSADSRGGVPTSPRTVGGAGGGRGASGGAGGGEGDCMLNVGEDQIG